MTTLLGIVLRASVILAAGLLVASCLRNRSAALRHFVLTVSLLSAAAVPVLLTIVPARPFVVWQLSEPTAEAEQPMRDAAAIPVAPSEAPEEAGPSTLQALETAPVSPQRERLDNSASAIAPPMPPAPKESVSEPLPSGVPVRLHPLSILMMVWLGGAFFGLMSILGGALHMRRLVHPRSRLDETTRWGRITAEVAAQYGLRRRVVLFECRSKTVLATWGVARPKLLLPAGAELWPEDRIRVVVHHELAHIQRGDWWIQLVAELHRAIYWFNPLCWILCRRLVRESEQACDDVALDRGISNSEYAEHLLELTRMLKAPRRVWSAALSMAGESTLERRFAAILDPKTNRRKVRGTAALATLLIFAGFALPLASFRAVASSPASAFGEITGLVTEPAAPMELSVSAVAAALTGLAAESQAPVGGPAAIRGRVVLLGGSEPVAGATVELRRIECGEGGMPAEVYTALTGLPNPYWTPGAGTLTPPQILRVTTGPTGEFAFGDLNAGSYCIVAFRGGGYLAAEYLQRTTRGPGSTISLAEGQQISGLNLALTPMGSISGRVTDARGEPVARAQVQALESFLHDGKRRWTIATLLQTNDLGEFRLYWLAPGRYFIAATPEDVERRTLRFLSFPAGRLGREESMTYPIMSVRELEDGSLQEETHTYVYYGGGSDPQKALPVTVRPGENTAGIDIPLGSGKLRSWRVRGVVTNGATGQPAANVSLRLMPREWTPNPIVPSASSDASGTFEITGAVPGSYFLYATGRNAAGRGGRASAPEPIPVPELIARMTVTVGASDLNDVKVVIGPGFDLPGRVRIEGLADAESASLVSQIRVRPLREPDILGQPAALTRDPVPSGADGSFVLTGIGPGDYRVYVEPFLIPARLVPPPPPPAGLQSMFVKAIRLGNADVLAQGLHLNGPAEGQIEIIIGKAGEVRGRVLDARQQPVVNVTVAAIPEVALRNRPDLFKKTRTDGSGRFRLFGVAPGDYKLFAWEQVEDGIWMDADYLRTFESRGSTVRVNEGRTENVDVTVIVR